MQLACARCIALLTSIGYALGFEDAAALIQHGRSVATLEAFRERTRTLPSPGSHGLRVSRLSASAEPGSSLVVNYSRSGGSACEEHDDFGVKECTLYYGEPFWKTVAVKLASGLKSGDVLQLSWELQLQHDTTNLLSFLVPSNFTYSGSCGFCVSSCSFAFRNPKFEANLSTPTSLDKHEVCNDTAALTEEDIPISDKSDVFLKPFKDLKLEGNMTVGLGVYNEDGTARVEGSWVYMVEPDPSAAASLSALVAPAVAERALVAQKVLEPLDLLQEVLIPQLLVSPLEELQQAMGLPASLPSAATRLWSVDNGVGALHAFDLNFTVKSLPPGASFSVLSDKSCTTTDSNGSVSCRFKVYDTIDLALAMNISFTSEEGSTMYASSKLTPGGFFGHMFGHKFKKKEMTVPLCGDPVTVTDVNHARYTYKPSRCGDYSISFASIEPFLQEFWYIGNVKFPDVPVPFLPKTLNEILPTTLRMELDMKDAVDSTIASVEMSMRLSVIG